MSLYNKYRPHTFNDVKQDHVTKVLKAQLEQNKVPAAYLFHGVAGTGKTTLSRIIAASLLCSSTEKPCGVCENCNLVIKSQHRDVHEINCAVSGGVDDVRNTICDIMRIAPSMGDYKVFILDEAHMLTPQAQNALLKTLEEPPEYVKFCLCTTDSTKILNTIKTRCQQHLLSRVSNLDLREILVNVLYKENIIEYDEKAINLIIEASDGSARTALVILEEVILIGVNEENLRGLLKKAHRQISINLLTAISKQSYCEAWNIIEATHEEGKDLAALSEECAKLLMRFAEIKIFKIKDDELISLSNFFNKKQIIELTNLFINLTNKIRQSNASQELITQTGLLTIIDRFAQLIEQKVKTT